MTSQQATNTSKEIEGVIFQLADGINIAQASYEIWFTMMAKEEAYDQFLKVMNNYQYGEFFRVTSKCHFNSMFIELSCLFDENRRTASFYNLKKLLKKKGHKTYEKAIENQLVDPNKLIINSISEIRNKAIAHRDTYWTGARLYQCYGVKPSQIGALLDCCKKVLKSIYFDLICSDDCYPLAGEGRFNRATYAVLDALRKGNS